MNPQLIKGIKCSVPIVIGYMPIGLAFGILAVQQGLSVLEILLMSLMVYAGSAQFIASAMIVSGSTPIAIITTTLLINLRHLLMSASLSPYLKHISTPIQSLIALGLTDETYGAGIAEASTGSAHPQFFIGLHTISYMSWVLSTVLGGIAGSLIPNPERWGLDFALSAMFIGLLLMQIKNKTDILIGITAGLISLIIALTIQGNYNIIIASVLAAAVGVCIEEWKRKFSLS